MLIDAGGQYMQHARDMASQAFGFKWSYQLPADNTSAAWPRNRPQIVADAVLIAGRCRGHRAAARLTSDHAADREKSEKHLRTTIYLSPSSEIVCISMSSAINLPSSSRSRQILRRTIAVALRYLLSIERSVAMALW